MNSQSFIHFLLIAVLGFSQLAANMHIVGHFHDCEDGATVATTDCESVDHQVYHAADGIHASDTNPKPSDITTDCAIYHVYTGLNGCLTTARSMFTVPVHGVANSVAKSGGITVDALDARRIRGPPLLS